MVVRGRKWEKVGNMFFGNYSHTIDEKGRLVIPSKIREEIGRVVYIMKGFDGALSIFKEETFVKLCQQIETLSFNKRNARAYERIQLANACELEIDKAGRVQLPAQLLAKYQIGKEVVILGVLDHIEVWNKITYEEYEKANDGNFEDIAESLENND